MLPHSVRRAETRSRARVPVEAGGAADSRDCSRRTPCFAFPAQSTMAQRITYRRRKSFNTRSNKIRKVKTPGGKLAVQYLQKRPRGVMCGDCKTKLQGVCFPAFRAIARCRAVLGLVRSIDCYRAAATPFGMWRC